MKKPLSDFVSAKEAWNYKILPIDFVDDILHLEIDENKNDSLIHQNLEFILGMRVKLYPVSSEDIFDKIKTFYPKRRVEKTFLKEITINSLIQDALNAESSDIHIERLKENSRIRMRIDGHLILRGKINLEEYFTLINKIKVASNLNIAEKRIPQDGRMSITINGEDLYIRVSVIPSFYGEKIVLRILGRTANNSDIEVVGFSQEQLSIYKKQIQKKKGIILISGPTGSGKTTTLYSTLNELNSEQINITTVEDPVEYILDGINQVQIKPDIGFNFSNALRSILRQDPDIIMIGEIRDIETAKIAIRASLTGHLVLSTIHTNSAQETVNRLIDMGIPEYLISSSLNISIAQRLIRKLCEHCKKKQSLEKLPMELKTILMEKGISYICEENGCDQCFHTGFRGRKAIFELIEMTPDIQDSVKNNNFNSLPKYKTLKDAALDALLNKETSLSEVYSFLI